MLPRPAPRPMPMKGPVLMRLGLGTVIAVAIMVAVINRDKLDPMALETWIQSFGALAPVVFIAIYAIAAVLFLPGSMITLAGGVLFGPVWGTLINISGATIGATLAFLIARYVSADWVAKRAGPRLGKLIEGVEAEGWRFVAFTRLVPLFPFNLLNYALGLTRIRLMEYVITSAICMIPGGFAYTYLGHAGREALAGGEGFVQKILLGLGLVAAVLFLPRLIKRLRRHS